MADIIASPPLPPLPDAWEEIYFRPAPIVPDEWQVKGIAVALRLLELLPEATQVQPVTKWPRDDSDDPYDKTGTFGVKFFLKRQQYGVWWELGMLLNHTPRQIAGYAIRRFRRMGAKVKDKP